MARKRNQATRTVYIPRNPKKYKGSYPIILRSRWEIAFAQFCDLSEGVIEWASEPLQIPYRNPIKGRQSVYVPDFMICYKKKDGTIVKELIEIKPAREALLEMSKTPRDIQARILNEAKWLAAQAWCQRKGIKFRVLTENELFGSVGPPKGPKKVPSSSNSKISSTKKVATNNKKTKRRK